MAGGGGEGKVIRISRRTEGAGDTGGAGDGGGLAGQIVRLPAIVDATGVVGDEQLIGVSRSNEVGHPHRDRPLAGGVEEHRRVEAARAPGIEEGAVGAVEMQFIGGRPHGQIKGEGLASDGVEAIEIDIVLIAERARARGAQGQRGRLALLVIARAAGRVTGIDGETFGIGKGGARRGGGQGDIQGIGVDIVHRRVAKDRNHIGAVPFVIGQRQRVANQPTVEAGAQGNAIALHIEVVISG